jgi:pyruvate/2-oxoglutarate/acetoin dehydrogenase E1 component
MRLCRSAWLRFRRPGSDATLVTYGAMVTPSLEAADRLAKEGVEVEVIDLRSLMPYDKAAIFASVEKTSRLLIVHEDVKTLGMGAELSAVVVERAIRRARRAGDAGDLPRHTLPVLAVLESYNLPNADKIADALRQLAAY